MLESAEKNIAPHQSDKGQPNKKSANLGSGGDHRKCRWRYLPRPADRHLGVQSSVNDDLRARRAHRLAPAIRRRRLGLDRANVTVDLRSKPLNDEPVLAVEAIGKGMTQIGAGASAKPTDGPIVPSPSCRPLGTVVDSLWGTPTTTPLPAGTTMSPAQSRQTAWAIYGSAKRAN